MANISGPVPVRNDGPEDGPARKRSRVACTSCNHRKVRCDVTRTGIPCSNCLHDQATACQVLPRKKHRPRRPRNTQPSPSTVQRDGGSQEIQTPPSSIITTQDGNTTSHFSDHAHYDGRISVTQLVRPSGRQRLSSLDDGPASLQHSGAKDPHASSEPEEVLPDDSSLTYIGDTRGPRFFVYDLCHPEAPQDAMPYLLPRQSDISWKPHEVDYLRHQGALTTLPDDICDDLIRCYFHHVHFFLPVVDAASFLAEYDNNGRQNISLLLFWSMLLAAANFVDQDVLQRSSFKSRKAMKTAFYERAKALYDLDHGTDKLVLIQSVILMGFWYTDPQDHTGAWYWIGIAISLSQTLGLHRCPQGNNRSQRLPETHQPLIRRIWWSCVVRDRWLSLAKGRPMRIHHEDCDLPEPGANDILSNLTAVPAGTRSKFIPPDSEALAKMWVNIVKISDNLGKILRIHYRVSGPRPVVQEVDASADELRKCRPQFSLEDGASDSLLLHAYHVELFYEATVAVLYRPYVLGGSLALSSKSPDVWQKGALEQARTAASNTNSVLERIIELNAVHLLKPMIITTIIPAMQLHLFDCKSSASLRRGLGKNKLSLCMLVLSQLRNTYWSASVIFRLFERAQVMLDKSKSDHDACTQAEKGTSCSTNAEILSVNSSKDIGTGYQQHQQHSNNQHQHQETANNNMAQIPQSNVLMTEQAMAGTYWSNDSGSPSFNNVDQLLSPGFSVPENLFQSFFTGYDTGIGGVYDQMNTAPNNDPVGLLYNV